MRRGWIAALTISALLLAGCGSSGAEEQFDRFRQSLETSGSVTVTAEVTAVSDEDVLSYTLSCAEVEDGYDIAVTGPELLSGVRAHLRQNDATLEFDNIVIPMGSLNDNGLSPLTALPCILEAARSGYADLVWMEGGRLTAQLVLDDTTTVRLHLNDALTPVSAEVAVEDATVIQCSIITWQQNERGTQYESDDPNLGGDQSQQSGT